MFAYWKLCSPLLVLLLLASCGKDDVDATPECSLGTSYNPILGECIRVANTNNDLTDTGDHVEPDAPEPQPDVGVDPPDTSDNTEDTAPDPDLSCTTDADGDGAIASECGGTDCDDNDPRRAPHLPELCDEVDNNCDGQVNEGLDCTVLAHSSSRLYRVDIFAGTFDDLGATVPDLFDIDTHPDGTVYGIAGTKLYSYTEATGWVARPGNLSFTGTPNGFCIDNFGEAYLTSGNGLFSVDLAAGTSSSVGSIAPARSSGDCVVNKGNTFYVTSSHTTPDSFVAVNVSTPPPQIAVRGRTQHSAIYGLTAAWNRMFGFTAQGEVIELNVDTGASTLIRTFPLSFYGAASTPSR